MTPILGRWIPICVARLWLPAIPERIGDAGEMHYACNGFSGFDTREQCLAECDQRNARALGDARATVERLERELSAAKARMERIA